MTNDKWPAWDIVVLVAILLAILLGLMVHTLPGVEPIVTAEQIAADPSGAAEAVGQAMAENDEANAGWWSWVPSWETVLGTAGATVTAMLGAVALVRRFASSPLVQSILGPAGMAILLPTLKATEEAAQVTAGMLEDLKGSYDEGIGRDHRKAIMAKHLSAASDDAKAVIDKVRP